MRRNMGKNRGWLLFLLPLLLAGPAVSLGAAEEEATAHLTFQKAVPRIDNKQIYIIRKGDTIARILKKLGWGAPRYRVIKQLNPDITDLNHIHPGQQLVLTRPGEPSGVVGDAVEVSNYTTKQGDSLSRIITELHAERTEAIKIFRVIKQLNPEIADFNKIHPGQNIKIPRGRLPSSTPAKNGEDEKALAAKPPTKEHYLAVIRQVIEQLQGAVISIGNHYIPLPESGQVTVDCAIVPIIELGEGTTIMLDQEGRLPDALAGIIQASWKNYHVVRIASGQSIASVLQEILRFSPSLQMVKMDSPVSFDDTPQVKLSLDWLITRQLPSGSAVPQLGLIFAADKSQLLPSSSIRTYALKKGIAICEILEDKVQAGGIPAPAEIPQLPQIKGGTNDELLSNFLVYLGFDALPERDVKIFDSRKDGFDLSIKAEYLMKMGDKILVITKNKLPQQFSERLKQKGMASFYPAPGATRTTILGGVLTAFDIPHQFAIFSLPPAEEKTRVHVSFSALKIAREKAVTYLIDYGIERELYELLAVQWKLNMMRY